MISPGYEDLLKSAGVKVMWHCYKQIDECCRVQCSPSQPEDLSPSYFSYELQI